jgi:hypothetical protein
MLEFATCNTNLFMLKANPCIKPIRRVPSVYLNMHLNYQYILFPFFYQKENLEFKIHEPHQSIMHN